MSSPRRPRALDGFAEAAVRGALIGAIFGAAECAAAASSGLLNPVPQMSTHIALGFIATLGFQVLLGVARAPRKRRAAWAVTLTAMCSAACVVAGRVRLEAKRSGAWQQPDYSLMVGGALGAAAVVFVVALAWGRFVRVRGRDGAWTRSRLCGALALTGGFLSVALALPHFVGLPRPHLGAAGLEHELRHDVLVITVDTLRADHLSQYGYPRPTGAPLERFGFVRFNRATAVSNWTKPTTATILTGLYPSTHTAVSNTSCLPREATTVLETAREHGAATGFCTGNVNASGVFGMDQGAVFTSGDPKVPTHPLGGTTLGELLRRGMRKLRDSRHLNRYALGFLAAARERRFFLYVHYNDPHTPYDPPREWMDPAQQDFAGRVLLDPKDAGDIGPEERAHMIARYDGEVLSTSHAVVQLLEELERSNRLDDTLVIVTADHGEGFGEHGLWAHANSSYEELLHIPLLIRPPGGAAAIAEVDTLVSQIDLVPTILDYLGVQPARTLPGKSLRTLIEGQPADRALAQRTLLTECDGAGQWSARRTDQKVIVDSSGGTRQVMLFDLGSDPHERQPLALDATRPGAAEALLSRGAALRRSFASQALDSSDRAIGGALEAQLRALGYMK